MRIGEGLPATPPSSAGPGSRLETPPHSATRARGLSIGSLIGLGHVPTSCGQGQGAVNGGSHQNCLIRGVGLRHGMLPGKKHPFLLGPTLLNIRMKVFLRVPARPNALRNPACRRISQCPGPPEPGLGLLPTHHPLPGFPSLFLTTSLILPPACLHGDLNHQL